MIERVLRIQEVGIKNFGVKKGVWDEYKRSFYLALVLCLFNLSPIV